MLRLLIVLTALCLFPLQAGAQARYPLAADDGSPVANHPIPAGSTSEIVAMPGVIAVGNPRGDVTLVEFYDVNCPYCRKAAAELGELIQTDHGLKLVLVPFPVLGIPSIEASRVELALAAVAPAPTFYRFHRELYAGRGTVDGERALAAAAQLGFDRQKLIPAANTDQITEIMKAHVRLGNALGLAATPSFVLGPTAIVGYPGRESLGKMVQSVRRCGQVTC
ncbi:MAG TPA: thioredoxin domain-containing protein [Xanthobacteraceae bacterium]|nr:thioredoxin domain-containing protein [Xanthobacteraceae bacterium]